MVTNPSAVNKFQKYLVVCLAFSVLWIYIGNIINFHQHRIWGKQLLPVASYVTRSKEKNLDVLLKTEVTSFQAGAVLKGFCSSGVPGLQQPVKIISLIAVPEQSALPLCPYQQAHTLRGPPIC